MVGAGQQAAATEVGVPRVVRSSDAENTETQTEAEGDWVSTGGSNTHTELQGTGSNWETTIRKLTKYKHKILFVCTQ